MKWIRTGAGIAALLLLGLNFSAARAEEKWADVVAAAEHEGKLVIAGPPIQPYRLSILEFAKAYPKIELDYSGLADAEFEAKLKAERDAGLHLWDIRIAGVSTTVFTQQIPDGWYVPIRPLMVQPDVLDDSKWLGGFAGGFMDNAKKYAYAFQAGLGGNIYIDRSQIPEAKLSSIKDLLKPEFKGKIAMIDPRERGGTSALSLVLTVAGEAAACDLVSKQEPVLTRTPRQLTEWAMTGRYPISTGMSPSEAQEWRSKGIGKNVRFIDLPPKERNWTPGWGAMLYVDKAPHPNAAKVFVNWMLSRAAQSDWASRGAVNSRRLDVKPGLQETVVDAETFKDGLTFNSENSAPIGLKAAEIARRCIPN